MVDLTQRHSQTLSGIALSSVARSKVNSKAGSTASAPKKTCIVGHNLVVGSKSVHDTNLCFAHFPNSMTLRTVFGLDSSQIPTLGPTMYVNRVHFGLFGAQGYFGFQNVQSTCHSGMNVELLWTSMSAHVEPGVSRSI